MHLRQHWPRTYGLATALLITSTHAQTARNLSGVIHDPLGASVPGATVQLIERTPTGQDQILATTLTNEDGSYNLSLSGMTAGSYRVRASAALFQPTVVAAPQTSKPRESLNIILSTATITQQITVTATGAPTPIAQIGAAVTVIPAEDYRFMPEIQEPLRLVPGVQITQAGQVGGLTALSIRGGDTDANKVLVDGVPANAIGGGVNFANLATVGFSSIEVLREPNSALFGSDAMAGVVSLTSTRGATPLPLLTYAGDGGNFDTYRNEVTAGTAFRQFDLYSAFARLDTHNNIPNSKFHNATYAGNFGWTPNSRNDLRFTVRHVDVSGGQPNAIAFYGIPDTSKEAEHDNYYNAVYNNQTTPSWHNQIRYGGLRLNSDFLTFGASGLLDPNTGYYDGAPVVITGANGYTVSGQAVFQFSNSTSQYLSSSNRDFVYAQTDYRVTPHLLVLGGFKYEAERGASGSVGGTSTARARGNYSYTIQLAGDLGNRLFYNIGTGLEDNGLFGFAATPRASLAYYLARPSGSALFSGTKLHGSFGKGIKEPSIYQQAYSLYDTLAALSNGSALLAQYHVRPLGPENSRTFDAGVDQQMFSQRLRLGLTYFHDEFTNGVQYVPQAGLIELGVPEAGLPAFTYGGAYLNANAFRTQGLEFESEYKLTSRIFARGGYTYTDAVVQHSFSSDNLGPSFNTSFNFSKIPIGAYSPLVGARPFRVAPHTGYFGLTYTRSKLYGTLTGTLVSRRDDSTFLSDTNFGNSLLLPNHNLDGSYQRLELGGGYQATPRLNLYANFQNLLSERYFEAFGYPALPLTFRAGLKLNFGGESWKLK